MSGSTRCWHCSGKLVNKNGHSRGPLPLIYAEVEDPIGNKVRVHKVCAKNAGMKPVTAQPKETDHGTQMASSHSG